MAKLLRFRSPLFSQPSKPFFFSSLSSSSSSDVNNSHYTKRSTTSSSESVGNKALYYLNCCKNKIHLFQIQAQLITSGVFQDPSFSGRLLKLSSSLIDDLCYTLLIFKCIDFPDAFCVNTVIKGYTCSNHHQIAVSFYVEALRRGDFYPNGFTFPPLISACAKLGCLSLGQMCHAHALKFGVVDHVLPVQNSLLHFYGCCRLVDVAGKVLDEMPVKDLVSWNTVIGGLANAGEMEAAHKMFDEMPMKNVVSWNVMITGYLNFGSPGNALQLFRRMMARNYESNDTTKVQVIAACARSNRLKEGKSIHGFIIKACTDLSLIIDTNMIDMYSKCGRADIGRKIFDKMPIKNLVSWNAMVLGHCIHGNPVDGLSLYSEMADKINPDELTFIGVLCACARLGLLTDGKDYFSEMIDLFHLKPNFAHYWCMANLMANIDRMEEAVSILRNIPADEDFSPGYSFWAGLLGSCRFQGDATLGEQIAKELIEQDPSNFSHYNLLVNVYALAGKRAEVSRTKEMMKERGIKRVACCSLKDLTEIVSDNAKRIEEIGAEC